VKTFYIETFGCQMNAHDSEKVVGTLVDRGYEQVATPEEAELVFYNTCSIRDKAEQKVFHRLQQFKGTRQGQNVCGAGMRGAAGGRKNLRKSAACEPGMRLGQLPRSSRRCWCSLKLATAASRG
jgi:tRNA-2-methylthio-N6-dimethylallyladenosine synthase